MEEFYTDKEKKVLELDVRRTIFQTIKKHAGSHFREIERLTKLPTGTVMYHLSYLVKHRLLKEQKEANHVRYFPLSVSIQNADLLSLLRQKSVRHILLFILTNEECNHEHIVEFTHLSPSTVSWHIKKLVEKEIISATKHGRKTIYKLTIPKQDIITLLITYQSSFIDTVVDNIIEMWEI